MTKGLLRSSNYWTLNKTLVKKLGIETAFLLTNLIEAEHLMKTKDDWFFQTIEKLEEVSTLSRHKQETSIKKLVKYNLISTEVKGMPAKRYFKINENNLSEFILANKFVKNQQTRLRKSDKQVCEKSATSKESTYKESTYKESNKDSHVRDIFNHYISKKIVNHQKITSAMRTAINARLRDYTYEQVIQAIDNYAVVYHSDKYWFDTKYTLTDLMRDKDVRKFIDDAEPLNNFKEKNYKQKQNKSDFSYDPSIDSF